MQICVVLELKGFVKICDANIQGKHTTAEPKRPEMILREDRNTLNVRIQSLMSRLVLIQNYNSDQKAIDAFSHIGKNGSNQTEPDDKVVQWSEIYHLLPDDVVFASTLRLRYESREQTFVKL